MTNAGRQTIFSGFVTLATILAGLTLELFLGGVWPRIHLSLAMGATVFATWRSSPISLFLWGLGFGMVVDTIFPVSFGMFLVAAPLALLGGVFLRHIFFRPSSLLMRLAASAALAASSLALISLCDRFFLRHGIKIFL